MFRKIILTTAICILSSLNLFAAGAKGEQMIYTVPAGYSMADQGFSGTKLMRWYVPKGDSKNSWSEMLVVEVDGNPEVSRVIDFFEIYRNNWKKSCAYVEFEDFNIRDRIGYDSGGLMVYCSRLSGSKWGEVEIAYGIRAHEHMFLIKKKWRVKEFAGMGEIDISLSSISQWQRFFKTEVTVCDNRVGSCHKPYSDQQTASYE